MNGFNYYKNMVSQIPVLSRQEEYEIAVKAAEGDKAARNTLIESQLKLVVKRVYCKYNLNLSCFELQDLVQEGNIGVIRAYEKFDVTKGFRFSTYCIKYIDKYIKLYLDESIHRIRIPQYLYLRLQTIRNKISEIENTGEKIKSAVLANELKMTREELETYLEYIQLQKEEDCDAPVSDEEDSPRFVDFYSTDWGLTELEAMRSQMKEDIQEILKTFLKEDERRIVDLRFTKEFTVREISTSMGYSESKVNNKLTHIKKKLAPILERDLEDFLYAA